MNVLDFPLFAPGSACNNESLYKVLTAHCIKHTLPLLAKMIPNPVKVIASHDFYIQHNSEKSEILLSSLFKNYGSDKSSGVHSYQIVYSRIFLDIGHINNLLEIGLGTNNVNVASHMGSNGKPGASLRAFKDFLPQAQIYGADFDKGILFSEERISTFFIDQTKPETIEACFDQIPGELDVLIEDGLHSPAANLSVLFYGLKKIRVGGWYVTEDIRLEALPVWEIVVSLLPKDQYEPYLIQDNKNILFCVKRLR